jgi:3'-5' exonuclease
MSTPLQKTMFIDIETVSVVPNYADLPDKMKSLWQKKSKVFNKDETDFSKTFENGAGIYAEFGKIVCVCLGYFTDTDLKTFRVKQFSGHDEKKLLLDVYNVFNKFLIDHTFALSGHNIKEFDVPYMCRRTIINQVELPFFYKDLQNRKPWENPLIDTLHQWRFGDFKNYTSLELIATVLGIDTPKDDIDGSQVSSVYWNEKNLDRIATYCSKDMVTVAQVLLHLNNMPLLSPENISFL